MKALAFTFSIIGYAIVFIVCDRLRLPQPSGPILGIFDDVSFVFLLAASIHLLYLLPTKWRSTLTPLLLLFAVVRRVFLFGSILVLQALMVGEWWHFEFYRDYIHYASLGYLGNWREISRGLSGFEGRYIALGVSLVLLILLFLLEKFWNERQPSRKYILLSSAILVTISAAMLGLSSYIYSRESDENWQTAGQLPLNFKNPLLELAREKFIRRNDLASITPENRIAIQKYYPEKLSIAGQENFPFLNETSSGALIQKKYNVIVIVGESFRGNETGLHHGVSLTPNFDRIARQSISASNFYANSNQTIKGEIAILCGLHDFLVGTSISAYGANLKTRCLPEIFKDQGYETLWFHGGYKDFYNRQEFFPSIGFNKIIDREVIENALYASGHKYFIRHWGIEDPYVFDYTFEQLQHQQQPFFAEIMTLSAHHPFFDIEHRWDIANFPTAIQGDMNNMYRKYQHAIYYTDRSLGTFWEKFSHSPLAGNTIVIIVGDHGIWLFPEGAEQQAGDAALYEMYTRLPFAMYVPGLAPRVINTPLSQVDIPMLLTSLLGVDQHTAFQSGLGHADAVALLQGQLQANPAAAQNPVFATLGDSFFYRQGNDRCYPTIASKQGCEDYLFRCVKDKHVLRVSGMACSQWAGDLLTDPSIRPQPAALDTTLPAAMVDFFRKSLFIGQLPVRPDGSGAVDSKLTHE